MKRILAILLIAFFVGPLCHAQEPSDDDAYLRKKKRTTISSGGGGNTFSSVTYKDSGPGSGGSVATVSTTPTFSLSGGDLIVCFTKGNTGSPTISMTDTAGNTWVRASSAIAGPNFAGESWYSITTTGNASEAITYHSNSNSFLEVMCQVGHRTSGTWTVDANPAYNGATSTSIASSSYSTTTAAEMIFFWAGSFGGVTFSAQSIGGQSPSGTNYIGTNGSTSDAFLSYYISSSTQTTTTGTATNSASDPYDAAILSFK
jgi:hypothetical protein